MDTTAQDNKRKKNNIKLPKFVNLTLILTIAIILVSIVVAYMIVKNFDTNIYSHEYEVNNIYLRKTEDKKIVDFVNEYFLARNQLDFDNIYKSFNKDHAIYKDTEEGKKYDNGILYEKKYIESYNNIVVYDVDGVNNNEKVLFITYDLNFYYSKNQITSLIITYLVKDGENIYFKDTYDVGETKYIDMLIESDDVKKLYADVKEKLEKTLSNDENLKLVYNSLRQYDINPDRNMFDDEGLDEKE